MEIMRTWVALEGTFGEDADPLGAPLSFATAQIAGVSATVYEIKTGRIALRNAQYPRREHQKWVEEDAACLLDWPAVWQKMGALRPVLPPRQWTLWWRFLLHNIMTADRLSYMTPEVDPECRHCTVDLASASRETPGHLLLECPESFKFWGWISGVQGRLCGSTPRTPTLKRALFPFEDFPSPAALLLGAINVWAIWSIMRSHWGSVFGGKVHSFPALKATFTASLISFLQSQWIIAQRR